MLFSRRPRTDEFEAAAMPHMNDIYRTAARLLGDRTGADDVVQDVYELPGVAVQDSLSHSEPLSQEVDEYPDGQRE
jgi:hypothetical protein